MGIRLDMQDVMIHVELLGACFVAGIQDRVQGVGSDVQS